MTKPVSNPTPSVPSVERWQLLLLFLATGEASRQDIDPLRVMKGMFLLEKKGGLGQYTYHFKPYSYGPFSQQVYRDLEVLQGLGYIERVLIPGRDWTSIRVTKTGQGMAKSLIDKTSQQELDLITEIQASVLHKGFLELLLSIYEEYPDYAVNSVVQNVHDLETDADPAGDKFRLLALEEQVSCLSLVYSEAKAHSDQLAKELLAYRSEIDDLAFDSIENDGTFVTVRTKYLDRLISRARARLVPVNFIRSSTQTV